jgi:hypothetical protein
MTTKPQQIILVILFFTMAISYIKAKLYVLKLRATSAEKTWLLFVNVVQKFLKTVQMCVPPYIQAGHGTQLSKSVLFRQSRDVWDSKSETGRLCVMGMRAHGTCCVCNPVE